MGGTTVVCAGGIVLLLLQLGWPAMVDHSISMEYFDNDDGDVYDIVDEKELAQNSSLISVTKRVKEKIFDTISLSTIVYLVG